MEQCTTRYLTPFGGVPKVAGRAWGYWTKGKLDILRLYLDAFTTASKKSPEIVYIDAFAGEPENYDRLTGDPLDGSAKIALSIENPPFSRLRFFETESKAPRLQEALRQGYPDRDFKVLAGDSNQILPLELDSLRRYNWAPTFAFLDPNGTETHWQTLEALAQYKSNKPYKVELFLLFPAPMFMRMLPTSGKSVRTEDKESIDRMFGTTDWFRIYEARLAGHISPSEARSHYLNLMRWRIVESLCYKWAHFIEVKNEQNSPIYYLIFATDHEAGDRIMRSLFAKAAALFPRMREEARTLRHEREMAERGQYSMFDPDTDFLLSPPGPEESFYEYEPPLRPEDGYSFPGL